MKDNTLKFTKNQRILFFLCWITYISTYVCRLNYSAVMPEMVKLSSFNNVELASISSAFFISYGISQIFTGALGDKFEAYKVVFIGLFLSAITNIIMAFVTNSLGGMIAVWAINGFSQSMIWSPLLKIGGDYFEQDKLDNFGLYMSTTVPFGTIIAYLLTILFLEFLPWNYVFLGCGLLVLIMSVFWLFYNKIYLQKNKKIDNQEIRTDTNKTVALSQKNIIKICVFVTLICLLPIAIHGALKDGITQFGPTYISSNFDVVTSFSLMVTMILPIINVTGAFIAKWLIKYLKNEFLVTMIFFITSLIAVILLQFYANVHIALTIILLAIITNSMFAINVMLISFIPLKFAKYGKTSTMSGILNAIAYLGCSISMIITGKILDTSSWTGVYNLWLGLAISGLIICLIISPLWNKIKKTL